MTITFDRDNKIMSDGYRDLSVGDVITGPEGFYEIKSINWDRQEVELEYLECSEDDESDDMIPTGEISYPTFSDIKRNYEY